MAYRVMQETETGEEFCVFTGTEDECDEWIEDNWDDYPESQFYIEQVCDYRYASCM